VNSSSDVKNRRSSSLPRSTGFDTSFCTKNHRHRIDKYLDTLLANDIALALQQNRLRWYGHVLRKDDDDWVK